MGVGVGVGGGKHIGLKAGVGGLDWGALFFSL